MGIFEAHKKLNIRTTNLDHDIKHSNRIRYGYFGLLWMTRLDGVNLRER